MGKRLRKLGAVAIAAIYVAAFFAFLPAPAASSSQQSAPTANFAEVPDMLPLSRSAPTITRAGDATELPAVFGLIRLFLPLCALLLALSVLVKSDAHYIERALKIQTARWCAS